MHIVARTKQELCYRCAKTRGATPERRRYYDPSLSNRNRKAHRAYGFSGLKVTLLTKKQMADWTLEKLRRKRDQAWDMAGLARTDGDTKDEARHTEDARSCQRVISERMK